MAITDDMLNKKLQRVIDDQRRAALKQALERGQREIVNRAKASAHVRADNRIILRAGENSVVDNRQLPHMPHGSRVVLSENVYQTLKSIADRTNQTRFETPFILMGHNEGQTVIFDKCETNATGNTDAYSASFDRHLSRKVSEFSSNAKEGEHKVLAHGHSHARIGNGYLNYSIADIDAYIKMHYDFPNIKDKVDMVGCLLTGGNFNFVFFDGNDTYRFDNVQVCDQNGRIINQLPCFGPDVMTLARARNMDLQNV